MLLLNHEKLSTQFKKARKKNSFGYGNEGSSTKWVTKPENWRNPVISWRSSIIEREIKEIKAIK